MRYTITSPTGITITKDLTDEQLHNLQQLNYYTVNRNENKDRTFEDIDFDLPVVKDGLRVHRKPLSECESCMS